MTTCRMRFVVFATALALSPSILFAEQPDSAPGLSKEKIQTLKTRAKTGPMAKLNPQLSALVESVAGLDGVGIAAIDKATTPGGGEGPLTPVGLMTVGDQVVIEVSTYGDATELLAELEGMGLRNGAAFGHMVSGLLPIAALQSLALLDSVVSVQPAMAHTRAGLVTSRGDEAMRSDVARTEFGVDGSGVRVGVMSDSYNCLGGAAADQASGDLPLDVVVLEDIADDCSDEGRAMMQIVHDVAPGASQAFHTAYTGQAGFAQGIVDLNEVAGAKIVVDDIIYFAEPMFQDGVIAQAVDHVRANGASYVSAAGNDERNSYESEFRPSGIPGVFGCERHDFDSGPDVDTLQTFILEPGVTFFSFQWDQPAASVSGAPGSESDIDIVVYLSDGTFAGLGGFGLNVGGDPIEIFGVGNDGEEPFEIAIALENCGGPDPGLMKYVYFGSERRFGFGAVEYDTASATNYGHANAAGAISVGASAWFNTAAFNTNPECDPACLNGFSSAGGVPILFDTAGQPIFELRAKPDIVGPDGANNTFFGFDLSFPVPDTSEPDGYPNFFGTSASAPHLAGVAALMSQATANGKRFNICLNIVNQEITLRVGKKLAEILTARGATYGACARKIKRILTRTAIDMDDPFTPEFDEGFDFASGYGFVDAREAVNRIYSRKTERFDD